MSDDQTPPQHVTRFYSNVDYALDVIANQQITFVHVSMLNDPFDPYFYVDTDFGESRGRLLKHIQNYHPNDLGWFKRHITSQSWQDTINTLKARMETWRDHTFIFSASGESDDIHPKDNLYMWGHYGNGHRGVAIEFDANEVSKSVIDYYKSVNGKPPEDGGIWSRVEYRKALSPLTAENYYEFMIQNKNQPISSAPGETTTAFKSHLNLLGRVKSEVWQRENEWRMMWSNSGTRMKIYRCPISPACITTVVLGLNLGNEAGKNFAFETKKHFSKATLLRAKRRHGNFALDFD